MTALHSAPHAAAIAHQASDHFADGDETHDDPNLAHHFDSPPQQMSAAKLGMWMFLATEVLFFGGLFVFYAVMRNTHPEIFEYGSRFLDWRLGAANTVVLIASSVTMAVAVTAAQRNQRRLLLACLGATLAGAMMFLVIKYFEYSHKISENLVWGSAFYENPHADEHSEKATAVGEPRDSGVPASGTTAPEAIVGDLARGNELFQATCRGCHGVRGEGMPGQGKTQRGSAFIIERTDAELVAFIKAGRMPWDPMNTTGIQMPPKGGNPMLKDKDLYDIVAYVRSFVNDPDPNAVPTSASGETTGAAGGEGATEPAAIESADASPANTAPSTTTAPAAETMYIPRSSVPPASVGPVGVNTAAVRRYAPAAFTAAPFTGHHSEDPALPKDAHLYFGVYYALTGLHGIHVLIGAALITWLISRAARGHFGSSYFTPLDLGGLYWHLVDLIWIFLFPLLYLI